MAKTKKKRAKKAKKRSRSPKKVTTTVTTSKTVKTVASNPRRPNIEPGDPEYHRRNIILPEGLAESVLSWHGGQNSYTYSLGSVGMEDYVSASMIDAAVDELEMDSRKMPVGDDRRDLENLIGELDAVARFASEHTAEEAGLGDVDSGYADWLMDNPSAIRGHAKRGRRPNPEVQELSRRTTVRLPRRR